MGKLAIIGTGISGLGCAHFLQRAHELTLFEKEARIGGHANTIQIHEPTRSFPVDTGFMVYNERTYPLLTRLFASLDVRSRPTSMSFSLRHDPMGCEFRGTSLNSLFAQRCNLLRPRFWRFLLEVNRFNREASRALEEGELGEGSLEDFLLENRFGADFRNLYLLPIAGAVWSVPPGRILDFPAETLIRFFFNHGFLGFSTHHQWLTVENGAREYVSKLTQTLRARIRTGSGVQSVERNPDGVVVRTHDGASESFDAVILACHADQALRLLARPDPREIELLAPFAYEPNLATVHTDPSVMPRTRRAWASWNYRASREPGAAGDSFSTHYWMNSLQRLPTRTDYFVSLNAGREVDPGRIIHRIQYRHPVFNSPAIRAQKSLPELNRRTGTRTFFCGSYFGYGFHEDGLRSAFDLTRELLGHDPWPAPSQALGSSRAEQEPADGPCTPAERIGSG